MFICINMNLALNNLQMLIFHKPKQTTEYFIYCTLSQKIKNKNCGFSVEIFQK